MINAWTRSGTFLVQAFFGLYRCPSFNSIALSSSINPKNDPPPGRAVLSTTN